MQIEEIQEHLSGDNIFVTVMLPLFYNLQMSR